MIFLLFKQEVEKIEILCIVWIGQFLFLFLALDFLVFEIILFQIFKFDFVFKIKKNLSFKILNPNKKLILIF